MGVDIFSLPVHPAAAVFPMLNDEELAELAEDIKANGLANPIIVQDGVLVDGRNRREACRLAGITPEVRELNGQDATAFIVSQNINRRHMTKGQRAMAVAMLYPEPEKRGRGNKSSVSEELGTGRISMARTIIKWAPELADAVLAGAEVLDGAYEIAKDRKTKAEVPANRLAALRNEFPDLADKVVEGALSLDDAEGAAKARRERSRANRQGFYDMAGIITRDLRMMQGKNAETFIEICREFPKEMSLSELEALRRQWIATLEEFGTMLQREEA